MNKEFKHRLNRALKIVADELKLLQPRSQRLYTPVFENGKYRWAVAMDSDGILATERTVEDGEAKKPAEDRKLCIGVLLQSEYTTSNTKPNPFGKAAIAQFPIGVWFDTVDGRRLRFDRVHLLFVLPKFVAPKYAKQFEIVARNVKNAAAAMRDVEIIVIKRENSAQKTAELLKKQVRKWLSGVGRPRLT